MPIRRIETQGGAPGDVLVLQADGTIQLEDFSAVIPPHDHAASEIVSGTIATARLGSGTADGSKFLRGDQTWAAPVASLSATEVEASLGSAPDARRSGRFIITDAAIGATSKVFVTQAGGPYTGKGTRADEAEMDHVACVAKAASGSATVYWHSRTRVRGNFKFHYVIGA